MMENKINYIIITFCALVTVSCNDSFLERNPTHDLNDNSFWNSANDLKVYNNGIYNLMGKNADYDFFNGFGENFSRSSNASVVAMETQSDNFCSNSAEYQDYTKIAAGQEVVPTNPIKGGWKWELLRSCNIFLNKYHQANVAEALKKQYAGEVYFVRAWFYLDKVQRFGDVPYVSVSLETNSPELYHARDPRMAVMDSVLRDINKAIEYLPETWAGDHPDRVDKWIALALKSRICLYEATYRKYHNMGNDETYFNEAVDASLQLINSGRFEIYNTGNVHNDYRTLFTSEDLSGNKEVLYARKYNTDLYHRISRYIVQLRTGVTKDLVDDFLCVEADGTAKPIELSTIYADNSIENVFDNRDPRMKQIVMDPREEEKYLKSNDGYPRLSGMSGWESTTGYHFIKYYVWEQNQSLQETHDAPLFRYAEVLLNYAEALAETGKITQADLDKSVNLIRKRAGLPDLTLQPEMDPKYASEGLSPLLVEIRRERRVELCFEQLRYQDLMRWKKGAYLAKKVLGMRFESSDREDPRYANAEDIKTFEVDGKNYIDVFAGSDFGNRLFDENKHYYRPIPVNVISKNPDLKQNPGWN
jgi:hypothetical protein